MFRPDIGYRCSDIVRVSDDSRRALDVGVLCCSKIPATFVVVSYDCPLTIVEARFIGRPL